MLKCECMWPAKWLAKINPHCEEVHVSLLQLQTTVVHVCANASGPQMAWQN